MDKHQRPWAVTTTGQQSHMSDAKSTSFSPYTGAKPAAGERRAERRDEQGHEGDRLVQAIASLQPSDRDPSKPPDDRELADRIGRAISELQDAMDAAVLAGLIVEPSFTRIENRLTRSGVRVDSFLCNVHIYRKLT